MRTALALAVRSVLVVIFLILAAPSALSGSSGAAEPQLVMLAEPRPPAGVAASKGALTLPYSVVEVFSGEPGSASVVVRHPQLDPMDRERLASGERVIVMARPDAENRGRWIGSAPLRATDEAIAAFRKWGAPSDVRAETPLSDAVAVAERSAGEVQRPVERATPIPRAEHAPAPKPATAAVPEPVVIPEPAVVPEPVDDEAVPSAPEWHEIPAVEAPTPALVPPPAIPEPQAPEPERAPVDEGPLTFSTDAAPASSLVPARGPGLPGAPTTRVLGPAFTERDDLKASSGE